TKAPHSSRRKRRGSTRSVALAPDQQDHAGRPHEGHFHSVPDAQENKEVQPPGPPPSMRYRKMAAARMRRYGISRSIAETPHFRRRRGRITSASRWVGM